MYTIETDRTYKGNLDVQGDLNSKKVISLQLTDGSSAISTGDGKAYIRIPEQFNTYNLIDVELSTTAPSTAGLITGSIERGRQASATSAHTWVDMLSTGVTIDATEYDSKDATTPPVINTANDDVATGDLVRVNIDSVGSAPTGVLICQLVLQN